MRKQEENNKEQESSQTLEDFHKGHQLLIKLIDYYILNHLRIHKLINLNIMSNGFKDNLSYPSKR